MQLVESPRRHRKYGIQSVGLVTIMLLAIGGILLPVNTLAVISVVAYGVLFVGLCFSSIAVVLGVRSHLMQLLSTD